MTNLAVSSVAVLALFAASNAFADPQPAGGSDSDDEDLEVPAASAASPGATLPPDAPSPAPSKAPMAPVATTPRPKALPAPDSADAARIAELERRLAALETGAATAAKRSSSALSPGEANTSEGEVAIRPTLMLSPFSQPVLRGFLVGGYVQADYFHSEASEDQLQQTGVPLNQNRFYLRRARLRVDRGWEYAVATLDLDANTVSAPVVGIRRAEASLYYQGQNPKRLPPLVMLTAGITDLPFGYELYESDRTAPFTERSAVSSALFPTKQDAGVKISGGFSFLRYGFAVTNGEPVDAKGFPRDPNDAKDVTGRVGAVVPVADKIEITGGASFVQGKGFHAGAPATKGTLQWSDTNGDGVVDIQGNEISGARATAAQPSQNFKRWAYGLDLGLRLKTRLGETHLHGEVIAASNYDRALADPVGGTPDVRQLGGYVALTQDVTEYGIVGFRVSVYDPNADFLETRHDKLEPKVQTIRTLSPLVGLKLPGRARLSFQYDFVHDYLGRDSSGVPADAKNNQYQVRLQVEL